MSTNKQRLELVRVARVPRPNTIEFVNRPIFAPDYGELLIDVVQCGVDAGTDGSVYTGKRPDALGRTMGHELSGRVVAIGPAEKEFQIGDLVSPWHPNHRVHGGMSPRLIVQSANCVRVPPGLGFSAVAEPLSCAYNSLMKVNPDPGADVVVIGPGFMAKLILKLLRLRGPRRVIVAGRTQESLEQAVLLGATHIVNLRSSDLATEVKRITGGAMADCAFECAGVQDTLVLAGSVLRVDGNLAIVGYHVGGDRSVPMEHWNRGETQLDNCHFHRPWKILHGMKEGIRLIESGLIDVDDLVSHRVKLDNVQQLFELIAQRDPNFIKGVVDF